MSKEDTHGCLHDDVKDILGEQMIIHSNICCNSIKKYFKHGEQNLTVDIIKKRQKEECIRQLFYKRLEKMCEGVK